MCQCGRKDQGEQRFTLTMRGASGRLIESKKLRCRGNAEAAAWVLEGFRWTLVSVNPVE